MVESNLNSLDTIFPLETQILFIGKKLKHIFVQNQNFAVNFKSMLQPLLVKENAS